MKGTQISEIKKILHELKNQADEINKLPDGNAKNMETLDACTAFIKQLSENKEISDNLSQITEKFLFAKNKTEADEFDKYIDNLNEARISYNLEKEKMKFLNLNRSEWKEAKGIYAGENLVFTAGIEKSVWRNAKAPQRETLNLYFCSKKDTLFQPETISIDLADLKDSANETLRFIAQVCKANMIPLSDLIMPPDVWREILMCKPGEESKTYIRYAAETKDFDQPLLSLAAEGVNHDKKIMDDFWDKCGEGMEYSLIECKEARNEVRDLMKNHSFFETIGYISSGIEHGDRKSEIMNFVLTNSNIRIENGLHVDFPDDTEINDYLRQAKEDKKEKNYNITIAIPHIADKENVTLTFDFLNFDGNVTTYKSIVDHADNNKIKRTDERITNLEGWKKEFDRGRELYFAEREQEKREMSVDNRHNGLDGGLEI